MHLLGAVAASNPISSPRGEEPWQCWDSAPLPAPSQSPPELPPPERTGVIPVTPVAARQSPYCEALGAAAAKTLPYQQLPESALLVGVRGFCNPCPIAVRISHHVGLGVPTPHALAMPVCLNEPSSWGTSRRAPHQLTPGPTIPLYAP